MEGVRLVMARKERILEVIARYEHQQRDSHYLAFLDCFNQQQFFLAHEVLEPLWLAHRKGPNELFYRGLIQLAGAFVHLRKGRARPCLALLNRARKNLHLYLPRHEGLDISDLIRTIDAWRTRLNHAEAGARLWDPQTAPSLELGS